MCINIVTNTGILYASKVIIITLLSTFGIFETYNNQDLNKSHEEVRSPSIIQQVIISKYKKY